jgi:hypothetical protein
LNGDDAPLACWRAPATATRILEAGGEDARDHWAQSAAAIKRLAANAGELQQRFLDHAWTREILRKSE